MMAEQECKDAAQLYEFDAPTEVMDLNEMKGSEIDDNWFDQCVTAAQSSLKTPRRSSRPLTRGDTANLPRAVVNPQVKSDPAEPGPSSLSTATPTNIVTSWGSRSPARAGTRPQRAATKRPPAQQPPRISKRKESTSTAAAPPPKKHRKSPVARPPPRRSVRRSPKSSKTQAAARAARAATAAAAVAAENTEPNSSEQQELERIRSLQKEVALHRRRNEASFKAALAGNPPPKKMVLSATIPEEFNFSTTTRSKTSATASAAAQRDVDFVSQLRKPASPARALRGATVPKPFNLSTGNKRKTATEEEPAYVPMAQRIQQFEKRTPERYHLRSRMSQERGPSPVKGDHSKLTQPHTPHLMTKQRSRPPTVKGSAALEAEEVEKLHKFKFKALELNRKILDGAEDLKKPAAKEPTVPEGFQLQVEKRLQERQASKAPEEEEHKFKAQPLPKKILDGVVGLPIKKVLLPTVPESPAFALKKRVHREPRVEEVKPPSPIRAPPVPHFGLPFQPRLEHHHMEACPFSFEERERERRALKEKRLAELRNEEVPQFKAQPLPDFDTVVLPEKKKLEPTKPEPFRLLADQRGAVKSSRLEQMVKEEQKQHDEALHFKARPSTVTSKEPFQPKKENRVPVVPEAFELSTERRARERQELERLACEREAELAMLKEEERRREEQQEKEEIARMRQEQVHKAQPIRHYKAVALKKSEMPLTLPQSPNFSNRFCL